MLQQIAKIALVVFLLSSAKAPSQVVTLAVVSSASYQADGTVAAEMIAAGFTSAIGKDALRRIGAQKS